MGYRYFILKHTQRDSNAVRGWVGSAQLNLLPPPPASLHQLAFLGWCNILKTLGVQEIACVQLYNKGKYYGLWLGLAPN